LNSAIGILRQLWIWRTSPLAACRQILENQGGAVGFRPKGKQFIAEDYQVGRIA
jgi:hypothetical protein